MISQTVFIIGARAPTKCELARDEKLQMVIVGTYIPQCEDDGSYSAVQCHGSTGYCWCVDGEGNKLVETEIRFDRPNCTKGKTCTMIYNTIPYHTIPLPNHTNSHLFNNRTTTTDK